MAATIAAPSFLATRRGKFTLTLLCAVAFLDFVDASIVNIALPDIRTDLHFSEQNLQWVLSGYLLTYGGFMLLGGRLADLLGRRRVLVTGTALFAVSSLVGGFATDAGALVGARLAQGLGAALMLPAALSLVTTLFKEGKDRNTALGAWGGMAGLASATGVFLGGVLTEGPGWRWVLFVNPPIAAVLLLAIFRLIPGERRRAPLANFDIIGTVLATDGMLLLVYALVKAPDQGWGSARTVGELAGAVVLLAAFLINEQRTRSPLVPLTIFRIRGIGAAEVTMLIAAAGLISMFFFLTLYMQNVLDFSPIQTGSAYLPFTVGVGLAAGVTSQLMTKIGDAAADRRRRTHRRGRTVRAVPDPVRRFVPHRSASRHDGRLGWPRRDVRGRRHRSERRRSRRQGRARRRPAQRLPTGRRRAGAGHLLRHRHRPHQPPVRRARLARTRTHVRVPTRAAGRGHLPGRDRPHCVAHQQQPRRAGPSRHAGRRRRARAGGTAVTADRPLVIGEVDFTMMYVAHDAFARDLRRMASACRTDHALGPRTRTAWAMFTKQLHIHHTAEDTALWPRLRAARLHAHEVLVLDAMERVHAQLDPQLERVDKAFAAADAAGLGAGVDELAADLSAHMRHEETDALPLVAHHLGRAGCAEFGQAIRRTQGGIKGGAEYLPWVLDDATADMQTRTLRLLPAPARFLYRRVWAPKYRRTARPDDTVETR